MKEFIFFISSLPLLISVILYLHHSEKFDTTPGLRKRSAMILFFGMYASIVFIITIAVRSGVTDRLQLFFTAGKKQRFDYLSQNVNLTPFATIFRLTDGWKRGIVSTPSFLMNVPGNIMLLFPIGIFPSFASSRKNILITLLAAFLISLWIETSQLITMTGSFDIDDILLNVCGAVFTSLLIQRLRTYNDLSY